MSERNGSKRARERNKRTRPHPSRGRVARIDATPIFAGGGEMGKVIAAKDWSTTALGPIESWSTDLRTTVNLALASTFPIDIVWGPGHVQIYNDGYRPICAAKHPTSMGQDFRVCWAPAMPSIGAAYDQAWAGDAAYLENQRVFLDRHGYLEETFFTFSFSPIRDQSGRVAGLFHPVTETTRRMLGERRVRTLGDVAAQAGDGKTVEDACQRAVRRLAESDLDLPFVLLYLAARDGTELRLAAATGLLPGGDVAPERVDLDSTAQELWGLSAVFRSQEVLLVEDLHRRFPGYQCGPYPEAPSSAFLRPIHVAGVDRPLGVLVVGTSSRLALDDEYRNFHGLLGQAIDVVIGNARAYEDERKRAEALAEIDRLKTTFFTNVSHEFRTPLTLILGNTEAALSSPERVLVGADLEAVHRNGLRLLRLVNTLLDFSRIEAGRVEVSYEETDLAGLTADLVSVFRSAIESAGLSLELDCPPLPAPVYVDRDMWEKIVLNLVSNAFKFTFEGEIDVTLRQVGTEVVLSVKDSGTGIAEDELPRVFERFHRIQGARARTLEGTGIGLALVSDLVHLHRGRVEVESAVGRGTTFTVTIPTGAAHLPAHRIGARRTLARTDTGAAPYVEEALRWSPSPSAVACSQGTSDVASADPMVASSHVLIADDNADMRAYLARLLRPHWEVEVVSNGGEALASARARPPDLVLSDVMMPELDGFGLLRELRADPRTRNIPVILLSARAGEASRIEGLDAGADDYLVKPFAARELVARVGAHLALAERRKAAQALLYSDAQEAIQSRESVLAVVSHDLRNPLSTIVSGTTMLRQNLSSDEGPARKQMGAIQRAAERMQHLIDDLMDFSSIERGRLAIEAARHDVREIVVEACEAHTLPANGRSLSVEIDVESGVTDVLCDRDRVLQVFSNLIGNAIKFTPAGGTVTVGAALDGSGIRFSVRDTGSGISDAEMPHVFDRYWQAARRGRTGLGLGLAIAKGIVEAHGGRIWAESTPRGGSTFFFTLSVPQPECVAHLLYASR